MTKNELIVLAKEVGLDLVGVAPVERFKDVAAQINPLSIFPQAKSIIVIGREIPRGNFRGVEEGTLWTRASRQVPPLLTYNLSRHIEDAGYVSVPVSPIAPERWPDGIPFEEGKVAPNVSPSLDYAAVAAGLGEIGFCRIFLTPQFGPRQSLGMIITDLELEPDSVFEGKVCDRENCMKCVKDCPLGAISQDNVEILNICGKEMTCGVINYEACKLCPNGTFPDTSYANAKPNRLTAICNRSCIAYLEESDKLSKKFKNPFRKKEPWKLGMTDV